MTRKELGLLALLLAVTYVAINGSMRSTRQWDEWEETRDSVLVKARADSVVVAAAVSLSDSLGARAAAAILEADLRVGPIRDRVVVVRGVEVPTLVLPFIAPRDSIIDDLLVVNDTLRHAVTLLQDANGELRGALFDTRATVTELLEVIANVPGPAPWWMPSLGAGVFVGICTDNLVCAGTGLTLNWSIPWDVF